MFKPAGYKNNKTVSVIHTYTSFTQLCQVEQRRGQNLFRTTAVVCVLPHQFRNTTYLFEGAGYH